MVGVVGSSPIAPTNILLNIKHPVSTLGAFFVSVDKVVHHAASRQLMGLQMKFLNIKNFFATAAMLLLTAHVSAADTAPCLKAQTTCSEWVTLDANGSRGLVYRTHALTSLNEKIEKVVVVVHGQGRNADGYFRHMLAAGFLADALHNTLIISPRFASNNGKSCLDQLDTKEVGWVCSGSESWRSGGNRANVPGTELNSFSFMDAILLKLSNDKVFPNLKSIVIAGHSAGGQYVNRYQFANQMHEKLALERRIQVSYVVGNPSSYTYPEALRPTKSAVPSGVSADAPGYVPVPSKTPDAAFVTFKDRNSCTAFNQWPYGLENKKGYATGLADAQLKRQLSTRPATYLLGELDILPLYGFDDSCAAMAQGPTRLARGFAYAQFVNDTLQANHKAIMVNACGHDARCMFTSETALPILFK
ncbi:MAG: hypothetical protein RL650_2718 [Pseudomonadota bacterium]